MVKYVGGASFVQTQVSVTRVALAFGSSDHQFRPSICALWIPTRYCSQLFLKTNNEVLVLILIELGRGIMEALLEFGIL